MDRVERNDAATFALKEDPPVQPQTHNELSYNHIAVVTARKSSPPKKRKSTESIEIELPKIPRLIDVKAEDVIHIKDEPDEERSSNPKPDFFPDSALTELENEVRNSLHYKSSCRLCGQIFYFQPRLLLSLWCFTDQKPENGDSITNSFLDLFTLRRWLKV